jgi:hypothetical protein
MQAHKDGLLLRVMACVCAGVVKHISRECSAMAVMQDTKTTRSCKRLQAE